LIIEDEDEETKGPPKRMTYAERQSQFLRSSEANRKTRKTTSMLRESFEEDRPPKREDVIKFLEAIRQEFMEAVKKGDAEVDKVVMSLGQRIFRGGLLTIQMSAITYKSATTAGMAVLAGANHALNFFGPYKWIFAASVYTVQTGINYRKYK